MSASAWFFSASATCVGTLVALIIVSCYLFWSDQQHRK